MFERPGSGERAILVCVGLGHAPEPDRVEEFAALARSAGAQGPGTLEGKLQVEHARLEQGARRVVRGCTHITEMLSYLPTAAVQTFAGLQREDEGEGKPFQLDRCHPLEPTSDTVRRYCPKWYRGAV